MSFDNTILSDSINLAFGDTLQYTDITQSKIFKQLSDAFVNVQKKSRREIELEFLIAYWKLAGQSYEVTFGAEMACYSASTAIEIIANYLKMKQLRTALIEPTFDNLPAILKRVGVDLVSIPEKQVLSRPNFDQLLSLDIQAIFVVAPNNPTGLSPSEEDFRDLIDFCSTHNKLLITDFCFRFFSTEMSWDQYAMALGADCNFLFIEDTGKAWPLLDLKTALLVAHPRIVGEIKKIHNEFLLHVSPFVLDFIRQYINSAQSGAQLEVVDLTQKNRAYLRDCLTKTILHPANINSRISFEWLDINGNYIDKDIWELLRNAGIYTLPGSLFYWNTPMGGIKNMRIALVRNPETFHAGIDRLANTLSSLKGRF